MLHQFPAHLISQGVAMESLHGLRVLVVEDEGVVAMLVEAMLEDLGCVVTQSAASVREALEHVRAGGFDFALLDVNLAGEKSYPVADELRRLGIPFAFASGYGTAGLRPDLADLPVVQKPFRIADLKATISAAAS
jgi:CheY-like chemotaxis protein